MDDVRRSRENKLSGRLTASEIEKPQVMILTSIAAEDYISKNSILVHIALWLADSSKPYIRGVCAIGLCDFVIFTLSKAWHKS